MPLYVEPEDVTTGELATASVQNTEIIGSIKGLRVGELALLNQAAGGAMNDMYAASSTQWAVGARQLRQTFRGLTARTHPDADKAAYQCLASCDEAVMSDGARVPGWSNILFDISAGVGAGGLDAGTEQPSTWYRKHLIRNSTTDAKAGILHRAKDYYLDQQNTTEGSQVYLREQADRMKWGQAFDTDTSGIVEVVDVKLQKNGSPTGRVWMALYATTGGTPTGSELATSNKLDCSLIATSAQWVRFEFRTPIALTAGTTYALVIDGDYTVSAVNNIGWRKNGSSVYAAGAFFVYNGSAWSSPATDDFAFKVYVTRNDTTLALPTGYDQSCHVGWVYNNSGSNFTPMRAIDRLVSHYTVVVSSGVATIATLLDMTTAVPPAPVVLAMASLRNDSAAGYIGLQPGIQAYGPGFGGYWNTAVANEFNDWGMHIPLDFQHAYYFCDGSATFIYPLSYRW